MSDAQHTEHEANHEGPIRTPKQLLWTVVASFVLPVIIIILLVNYVAFDSRQNRKRTVKLTSVRLTEEERLAADQERATALIHLTEVSGWPLDAPPVNEPCEPAGRSQCHASLGTVRRNP